MDLPESVAAVARALDVDPMTVRADTPLGTLGWTGSAGEWAVVSDHLGLPLSVDPPREADPQTIADLVTIVEVTYRHDGNDKARRE